MTDQERRIQSCIDHINTSVDVDPWAKELAEQALKKQIPQKHVFEAEGRDYYVCYHCPSCNGVLAIGCAHCITCGQAIDWSEYNDKH